MSLFLILVTTVFTTAFFAWGDRWSGGGLGWEKLGHDNGGPLRSHPRNYVLLALLALHGLATAIAMVSNFEAALFFPTMWGLVQSYPVLAVAGVSFMFWRAFGWDMIFKQATIDPRTKEEKIHTFLRHTVFPALPIAGAAALGLVAWWAVIAAPLFGAAATYLAVLHAKGIDAGEDNNDTIELNRGIAFGLIMGLVLGLAA